MSADGSDTPELPAIDERLIRGHVKLIHDLAAGIEGKIVVASFGQNPRTKEKLKPEIRHFSVGEIDAMVRAIRALAAEAHRNVYAPLCVMRNDLPEWCKGEEADIVAQLGFVLDADDASVKEPLRPNYAIETSAGHKQPIYLLAKPMSPAEAKELAVRLAGFARDTWSADISHVWRIPGTRNWPNEKKVSEGRAEAPQPVRVALPWDGTVTPAEALENVLPWVETAPEADVEAAPEGSVRNIDPDELALTERKLKYVADIDHNRRVRVGHILKFHFGNYAGFNLFRQWRMQTPDYPHANTMRDKWAGFHPDGRLTLGTLTMWAQEGGWTEGKSSGNASDQSWPAPLDEAAYHGLIGEIVRAIAPHTEADPAAILLQMLTAAGNVIGRRHYYFIDGVRHHANLFTVTVGRSAKGRKGTSWARAREVFANSTAVDDWLRDRIMSGLSSGEGLIEQVRDPISKMTTDKKSGYPVEEKIDEGVSDKRLLIVETEFSRTLRVMLRTDNTLSAIMRAAWDGDNLHVLARKSPLHATAPHISMVAHTTVEDLRRYLQATDAANGFGNRFLFACAERSKLLALGADRDDLRSKMAPLENRLRDRILELTVGEWELQGVAERELGWADNKARERWTRFYEDESAERPGMFGAITARGEAQVVRLTLLYALLDGAKTMKVEHLEAAIAIWRYCVASARHIFGDSLGDGVADTALTALRSAGHKGMTRSALRDLFGRHVASAELGRALALLLRLKLVAYESRDTGGRPSETWRVAE